MNQDHFYRTNKPFFKDNTHANTKPMHTTQLKCALTTAHPRKVDSGGQKPNTICCASSTFTCQLTQFLTNPLLYKAQAITVHLISFKPHENGINLLTQSSRILFKPHKKCINLMMQSSRLYSLQNL